MISIGMGSGIFPVAGGVSLGFALAGILIALIFVAILLPFNDKVKTKGLNLPPGPRPFWLLGSFPYVIYAGYTNILTNYMKLGNVYGKVYTFYLGEHRAVVINDLKILRETFLTAEASGRPKMEFCNRFHNGLLRGIIIQEGKNWKQLRAFTLKQLRDYGFGKRCIESIIHEEALNLRQLLQNDAGKPIGTKNLFNVPVINVLWQIIAGERFSMDDPAVNKTINAWTSVSDFSVQMATSIFFESIAKRFPNISGYNQLMDAFLTNFKFAREFVHERIAQNKDKGQIGQQNFTDVFLQKIQDTSDTDSNFYGQLGEENLRAIIGDLFLAGAETSSTTLRWLSLFLAVNPDKQSKLQNEIDQVLEGAFPTLAHRLRMPYTEAVIMETLRMGAPLAFGLFHCATVDMKIGPYDIPQDTLLLANLHAIHHDPEIWGNDAEEFKPERFLSPDGTSVVKHDAFIPFSIGKRVCPGDRLARDELFIFVASMCQTFSLAWNPKKSKPKTHRILSAAVTPLHHELIFSNRNQNKIVQN